MVSESLEPSNWRLIERRSFTSVTKTVTKTTDPIGTFHKLRYHFLEILTPIILQSSNVILKCSFNIRNRNNHCLVVSGQMFANYFKYAEAKLTGSILIKPLIFASAYCTISL